MNIQKCDYTPGYFGNHLTDRRERRQSSREKIVAVVKQERCYKKEQWTSEEQHFLPTQQSHLSRIIKEQLNSTVCPLASGMLSKQRSCCSSTNLSYIFLQSLLSAISPCREHSETITRRKNSFFFFFKKIPLVNGREKWYWYQKTQVSYLPFLQIIKNLIQ